MRGGGLTIFRYRLPIEDAPTILMAEWAEVVSVGPPRDGSDELDLWAIVDPRNPSEPRGFRVVGTGGPIPPDSDRFIGTVATHSGALVWHVFETYRIEVAS